MRPNIFEISTKELTQDAFITWLIKWADPSNNKYDTNLHKCGIDFVKYLIKKQFNEDIEINKVEAGRQRKNIDIWADVNEKYFIIIEDKIFASEHSNQLERYRETAIEWYKDNHRELVYIYLKTGTEAKSSLKIVSEKGFSIIERLELINFFKRYRIKNNIFIDFVKKINRLEKVENAYDSKKIKLWDWNCWIGFYHFLDTKLEIADWRYVANPSGGFLGIWWHFLKWKDYNVYIQIEQGNLCFKIGEVYENRKDVRDEWFNILMKKSYKKNRNEINKPIRFGNGTYMTVAIVERKNWLGDDNEIINKEKVLATLKEYEKFLKYCIK
jgi:hypothetical protein